MAALSPVPMNSIQPAAPGATRALVARNLVKHYQGAPAAALNQLSLEINQGEFYGLLGANGAGKSTAVAICSGLFAPDRGTVSILGRDYLHQARRTRALIGLVPQELALYQGLTARENLSFFGRLAGLSGSSLQQGVNQGLEFARLEEQGHRRVVTFSGGMKRRLNLAAGLLHRPRLLFLDEPTVGIDAQSRHLIHRQLRTLNQEGTTILYTSHYLEEARELCSRIGIIDQGSLIDEGTTDQLLRRHNCERLEELFLNLTGKELRDR
ncbi:ABC transporter ATP-binding protein [Desulfogranum mediterraneum]|uniref:ABC transporter ATP-binding protein n=1 Tax=Desulfogranum mediterraneum TaxID=160661 RepID=UPI000408ABD0|nr:ABC transporter ATP-binding protein [Desulfogranum mediterraneum]